MPDLFNTPPIDIPDPTLQQTDEPDVGGQSFEDPADDDNQTVDDELEDVSDVGQGDQVLEPSWASEYASPEEMYEALRKTKQSYDSLLPEYTKSRQELSRYKQVSTKQPQAQNTNLPPETQAVVEAITSQVNNQLNPYIEQQEELVMENTLMKLTSTYADFNDYQEEATRILENQPQLWELGMAGAIETAYKLAKVSNIDTIANQIAEERVSARQQSAVEKRRVASAGKGVQNGVQAQTPDVATSLADSIVNAGRRTVF